MSASQAMSSSVSKATMHSTVSSSPQRLDVYSSRGGSDALSRVKEKVKPSDWDQRDDIFGRVNEVRYKYLESTLKDMSNYIYEGSVNGEVISLLGFFRSVGRNGDATITLALLWTKGKHRFQGYCKELIGICIEDLMCGKLLDFNEAGVVSDNSVIKSGTYDTVSSRHLYKSLGFKNLDVAYAITAESLLKAVQEQGRKRNIALCAPETSVGFADAIGMSYFGHIDHLLVVYFY